MGIIVNLPFKRVVLMSNQVDRLGGVSRFIERVSSEFLRRGFLVEIIGVNPTPKDELVEVNRPAEMLVDCLWDEHAPENWTLNRRRDRLNPFRRRRNARRHELRSNGCRKLSKKLVEWGPETVILCTQVFGMEHLIEAGYDPLDRSLPRVIGQYHGSYEMCVQTGDLRRVLKNYKDVDRFVCLTADDAALFTRAGLNNVSWLPNPVADPSTVVQERENTFVTLGRYDKQKSLHYVVKAWESVYSNLPDWKVELYGEGPLGASLQEMIDDLKLPRIRLMGKTDMVGEVLSSSKVHLLSSQYEGLPIAIVEASLAGVPTISFDCAPGIRDLIIDSESGIVVRQNNVSEFAASMEKLALEPETLAQYSDRGRMHAQQYLPSAISSKWITLFNDLQR
ncbi:hypothetical protein C1H84_14310 [Glutamicibacter soli]|uniref:Glycosyl transferase family 1 domain-containing protein n=2 Tax=Micrococcales TaxID=85006 RepID=A0A365YA81_9MICC|nr:hypothetical protein C1H84_14310 [Glutamicibacter soli]